MDPEIKSKELMFEYDQLRKEILQNDVVAIQISGGVFLVVSALMGFALTRGGEVDEITKGSLFMVAVLAGMYGLFQTAARVSNTHIIASYLRVYVEPETTCLRWETRLSHYMRNPRKGKRMGLLTNQGYIYTPLIVINYLLACRFFNLALRNFSNGLLTILFVIGLFTILGMIIAFWPGRGIRSYDGIWRGEDLPHTQTLVKKILAKVRIHSRGSLGISPTEEHEMARSENIGVAGRHAPQIGE